MSLTGFLQRWRRQPAHDVVGFLLFSHGWTWAWWGVNVLAGYDAFGPGLPFTVLGGVGPLLGGVVMSYVTYGRAGLVDLWERLTDIDRIPLRWAVVTVALFPALVVVTAVVASPVVGEFFSLDIGELAALLADPGGLVGTVVVILVVGPLPEEIGWRGYLLDRCQARWSALASGVAVGAVWAVWHAPLFVMPGYFATFDFAPVPSLFAANILLGSVIYTWLYNNVGRSVLALVVFHFMENFVGQMTAIPPTAEPVGVAVRALVVVGLVVVLGAGTLRWDGRVPSPPAPAGISNASPRDRG